MAVISFVWNISTLKTTFTGNWPEELEHTPKKKGKEPSTFNEMVIKQCEEEKQKWKKNQFSYGWKIEKSG